MKIVTVCCCYCFVFFVLYHYSGTGCFVCLFVCLFICLFLFFIITLTQGQSHDVSDTLRLCCDTAQAKVSVTESVT